MFMGQSRLNNKSMLTFNFSLLLNRPISYSMPIINTTHAFLYCFENAVDVQNFTVSSSYATPISLTLRDIKKTDVGDSELLGLEHCSMKTTRLGLQVVRDK